MFVFYSESYGLIATRAGDNVEKHDPDFKRLPTFYALSDQYKKIQFIEKGGSNGKGKKRVITAFTFS